MIFIIIVIKNDYNEYHYMIKTYEIKSKEFMWAYSLNDKGKITYDYIVITVKPLDSK